MLNTLTLKKMLVMIFGMSEEQVVPITTNWFLPDVCFDNLKDVIGYRILSKSFRSSEVVNNFYESGIDQINNKKNKYFRTEFRLSFVGEQAEQLSERVLLWEEDYKIREMFEAINVELDLSSASLFTYPMKSGNKMAWIVDIGAVSLIE